MSDFNREITLWKAVTNNPGQLFTVAMTDKEAQTCPFCGKASVGTEIMETVSATGRGMMIGFFSCRSCNESWSNPIR